MLVIIFCDCYYLREEISREGEEGGSRLRLLRRGSAEDRNQSQLIARAVSMVYSEEQVQLDGCEFTNRRFWGRIFLEYDFSNF